MQDHSSLNILVVHGSIYYYILNYGLDVKVDVAVYP